MRDSGQARGSGGRRPIAELFLLGRASRRARAAAAMLAVATAILWGCLALALHEHELWLRAGGTTLNPIGRFFADAASPLTVWPGWLAAAVFCLSALRLRQGPIEPPTGRREAARLSAAELRGGLRREYLCARLALVIATLLALLDLGRLLVSGIAGLRSVDHAAMGLGWMAAEAAGIVAAALALLLWVISFRDQLGRLGALQGVVTPPGR
ncbi:MAG: hypothetical protein ABSA40_07055 [Candidatus Dormibacteria bacterium]|jgi:hypothetical protein